MGDSKVTRRETLTRAGKPLRMLAGGQTATASQRRLPPRDELVNVFEYEDAARLALPALVHTAIAGSNRAAFDRITFRPRMLIPTLDLDLSVELFRERHFAPILVGPVAEQRRIHSQGELATIKGASAAKAGVILSNNSSLSVDQLAPLVTPLCWYSVYADVNPDLRPQVERALAAGCKVLCITVGATPPDVAGSRPRLDWTAIDRIRKGLNVPIVLKGIMTPADARAAIERGIAGVVVSDHGQLAPNAPAPIDVLPSIADAAAGKATVLIDGSFRRGSDILKGLILGAQAVLIARPVMWGLGAYGADGVQSVIEMLQTDLGRQMGALGVSNLNGLNRDSVRLHKR